MKTKKCTVKKDVALVNFTSDELVSISLRYLVECLFYIFCVIYKRNIHETPTIPFFARSVILDLCQVIECDCIENRSKQINAA